MNGVCQAGPESGHCQGGAGSQAMVRKTEISQFDRIHCGRKAVAGANGMANDTPSERWGVPRKAVSVEVEHMMLDPQNPVTAGLKEFVVRSLGCTSTVVSTLTAPYTVQLDDRPTAALHRDSDSTAHY